MREESIREESKRSQTADRASDRFVNEFNSKIRNVKIAPEPDEETQPHKLYASTESQATLAPKLGFRDGLFSCFSNLWPSCCCVTLGGYSGGCLPMYLAAQISGRIKFLDTKLVIGVYAAASVIFFFIALIVALTATAGISDPATYVLAQQAAINDFFAITFVPTYIALFYLLVLRFEFVRRLHIKEDCLTSICIGYFFAPCSLCQMARHLYRYKYSKFALLLHILLPYYPDTVSYYPYIYYTVYEYMYIV